MERNTWDEGVKDGSGEGGSGGPGAGVAPYQPLSVLGPGVGLSSITYSALHPNVNVM